MFWTVGMFPSNGFVVKNALNIWFLSSLNIGPWRWVWAFLFLMSLVEMKDNISLTNPVGHHGWTGRNMSSRYYMIMITSVLWFISNDETCIFYFCDGSKANGVCKYSKYFSVEEQVATFMLIVTYDERIRQIVNNFNNLWKPYHITSKMLWR